MSIATKYGDEGRTKLFTGESVSKSHIKVETYGNGDELISFLGWLKHDVRYFTDYIDWIQKKLFIINAVLASGDESTKEKFTNLFLKDNKYDLQDILESLEAEYGIINEFIIPSETPSASKADICRSVCRRFERTVVLLSENETIDKNIIIFINRLSDVLFMMARVIAKREGGEYNGIKRSNT
jgi:cob(I)alamin adenosyltransferase